MFPMRRVTTLVLLAMLRTAHADAADGVRAVEGTSAVRGSFVERTLALRAIVPDALRVRVLLTPPEFRMDGRNRVVLDPELAGLVELSRGSTDPVVLAVLVERCGRATVGPPTCDALEIARRWVDSDTQNQRAWLALASVLESRKDHDGARAAFERASQASVWRDDSGETGRYLVGLLPKDLAPAVRTEALSTIFSVVATSTSQVRYDFVSRQCKAPGAVAACHRILSAMYDGADRLLALAVATRLSVRHQVDATTVERRLRHFDAMTTGARMPAPEDPDDATASDAHDPGFDRALEDALVRGELRAAQARLDAAGVTEGEAAARARPERLAREKALDEGQASVRRGAMPQ